MYFIYVLYIPMSRLGNLNKYLLQDHMYAFPILKFGGEVMYKIKPEVTTYEVRFLNPIFSLAFKFSFCFVC